MFDFYDTALGGKEMASWGGQIPQKAEKGQSLNYPDS